MYLDWPFRLALILIAGVHLSLSRRFLKASKAGGTVFQNRAEGLPLSVATGVAYGLYCLAVLVYLVYPSWMAWGHFPLGSNLRWMGAVLMALGSALHLWGMAHLGQNLTISISTRAGHCLITDGPFSWVRHPLYVGGMIESLGVCLLLSNGAVALCAGAFWGLVVWRTPLEEQVLREAFGEDYDAYCARVGRFFPRLWCA